MKPPDSSVAMVKLRMATLATALCGLAPLGGCGPFDAQRATTAEIFSNRKVRALVEAAEKGDVATIDAKVKEGVNVNAKGRGNVTPLLRCLLQRNKDGYEALLRHEADPNVLSSLGSAVVHEASEEDDPFWLRLALEHRADPNLVNANRNYPSRTPLYYAISPFWHGERGVGLRPSGRVECVKLLIAAGADLNHKDANQSNPLRQAVLAGNYEIVLLLLEGGADFRQRDREGQILADWIARRYALPKEAFERLVVDAQRPWFRKCVDFLKAKGVDLTSEKEK